MNIAYFDCINGAAGDMILGALIDAGAPVDKLRNAINALPIDGFAISVKKVNKQGFSATRFAVVLDPDASQPHRHLTDVRAIISASDLPPSVRKRAVAIFQRLAVAEAKVHGTTTDRVHFHEVGAVDAIIDIVGTCWAVDHMGINGVVCSPLPVGGGTVDCEHGVMPVPAPATAELLKNVPIAASDDAHELTTPTGAAILTELADRFGLIPAMTLSRIGTGSGSRDGTHRPNVLRVFVGKGCDQPFSGADSDRVIVLEANIDDATPEVLGYTVERLLNAGALDAYCLPIQMKKSRPAVLMTVLAPPDAVDLLEDVVFAETTTFGIRRHEATRSRLTRRVETIETTYGMIRIKIGSRGSKVLTASPEYEDSRQAAIAHGVPLRTVMDATLRQWQASRRFDAESKH